MFESISIPRKVNNADVNEAFPFKAPALDVYDIKQGRELVKLYKEYHKECFLKGFKVANLLKCETQSLDNFLKKIWEHFLGNKFDYLTLVAVGGYGRAEQFIESDIDLLIVSNLDPIPDNARDAIESLFLFMGSKT